MTREELSHFYVGQKVRIVLNCFLKGEIVIVDYIKEFDDKNNLVYTIRKNGDTTYQEGWSKFTSLLPLESRDNASIF